MDADPRLDDLVIDAKGTRWIPSSLLDLPPLEPVFALRTPHRVFLQAMPSSREALRSLLQCQPFEICVEIDDASAPLQHVPVQDVHEVCLVPHLPLPWEHYYWLADGLQNDLLSHDDPGAGLFMGRRRLLVAAETLGGTRRGALQELALLRSAWQAEKDHSLTWNGDGDLETTAVVYAQKLTQTLVERTSSRAFADWMADLRRQGMGVQPQRLPSLSTTERALLGTYLQHRALGNVALSSPAGMITGWQLLVGTVLLALCFADILVRAGYEALFDEALVASLWMLDQGFWCDEALVHETLRALSEEKPNAVDLTLSLAAALSKIPSRA
jgi:hypothetical protein